MVPIEDFVNKPFKVLIGTDHGGFEIKKNLVSHLQRKGVDVEDLGPYAHDPADDYPDFANAVAGRIARGEGDCGVLICRTGIGMCINANRYHNVRAALADSPSKAAMSRNHNCSNVLVTGGDDMTAEDIVEIVEAWLKTPFSFDDRHIRRLAKVEQDSYDPITALRNVDPEIAGWIDAERRRQDDVLELIASENVVSPAIRAAQASCLTNKYAEGYPKKRWYNGCEYVDEAERLAIERALELFGAESANVQPHSGSQANMATYFALLDAGDTVLAMDLAHGGHLTHGMKLNFSGRFFDFIHYGVDEETERLDYDNILALAKEHKPRMILIGASAYPRQFDFPRLREIADAANAYLVVDMAHFAGLVAAGVHPSPVPYADVVTTTTHKTLRGPRAGLILCREKYIRKINVNIFPGIQGGPLMHTIAAKAVCFKEAMSDDFKAYQSQVVRNAQALAAGLAARGFRICSGGTDNHLMLVDLRPMKRTGNVAADTLDAAGITVNKNLIPFDPEKPIVTSGLRIGTPVVTTRGMKEGEMETIAALIHRVIDNIGDSSVHEQVLNEVKELTRQFPVPGIV